MGYVNKQEGNTMTAAAHDESTRWDMRMALGRLVPCFEEDFRVTYDTRDAVAAEDVAAWMSDVLGREVTASTHDDFAFDAFEEYLRHLNVFLTLDTLRFVGLRRVVPRKRSWIHDVWNKNLNF